nr:MAG TPA: hypothetical protein [Siphoviridae sp. ctuK76]
MKIKVTRNDLKRYENVVQVGFCKLQTVLRVIEPFGYNATTQWNYDVYEAYGVTIVTGSGNMPGRKAVNVDKYEQEALRICRDTNINWVDRDNKLMELLHEFCVENGGY